MVISSKGVLLTGRDALSFPYFLFAYEHDVGLHYIFGVFSFLLLNIW